jgi:cyclopropane-fatty-acyl-phospholipid synthase
MFLGGTEAALGEAYLFDDFDIEGQIEAVHGLADSLAYLTTDRWAQLKLATRLLRLPRNQTARQDCRGRAKLRGSQHSIDRDCQAIRYHYDVSNAYYSLWLDSRMVYSCAYFRSPNDSLDEAQSHKLDLICRKLRLQPGQRLLDLGCGWGGLAIWAAQYYGTDVTGITLSQPQADLANECIAAAGLANRCRVLVQDYRQVENWGQWDALVSVGMFEHVGGARLSDYFQRAFRLLRPEGVFLNHGIARRYSDPWLRGKTFGNTYVFPDGELVPISLMLDVAEAAGFEVRDVESLREHYALTLRHWVRRLEEHHDEAAAEVGEPTYRIWRLYMSGSAHGFTTGRLNVNQALLVKPAAGGASGLPLTREDWYRG